MPIDICLKRECPNHTWGCLFINSLNDVKMQKKIGLLQIVEN
jgi:hypothetical protein